MEYLIKKGRHYANFTINRPWPFTGTKLEGGFSFDKACATAFVNPTGWNKLTGISSLQIHKNSGRLVWMPDGLGGIKIAGYVYDNGIRRVLPITTVKPDEQYSYSIEYFKYTWVFKVNGITRIMAGELGAFKIRCFPYFGGQAKAPTDLKITLI